MPESPFTTELLNQRELTHARFVPFTERELEELYVAHARGMSSSMQHESTRRLFEEVWMRRRQLAALRVWGDEEAPFSHDYQRMVSEDPDMSCVNLYITGELPDLD